MKKQYRRLRVCPNRLTTYTELSTDIVQRYYRKGGYFYDGPNTPRYIGRSEDIRPLGREGRDKERTRLRSGKRIELG